MKSTADYKLAVQVVDQVIQDWAPYGLLRGGSPKDEFDAEIAGVVAQIPRIKSPQDAAQALSRVFSSAFDSGEFDLDACTETGHKLFQALSAHALLPSDPD